MIHLLFAAISFLHLMSSSRAAKNRVNEEEDLRRQQNRQAQREFRLRKQREKEELKARIEFLERDPDQQSQLMTKVARELYAENNRLRALVQSLRYVSLL